MSYFVRIAGWLRDHSEFKRRVECKPPVGERYQRGIASYGKKVKSEKRKERILAELKAMGVKPRVRRKAVCVKVKTFGFPKRAQPSIYVVNPPMYVGVKRGVVFAYNRRKAT